MKVFIWIATESVFIRKNDFGKEVWGGRKYLPVDHIFETEEEAVDGLLEELDDKITGQRGCEPQYSLQKMSKENKFVLRKHGDKIPRFIIIRLATIDL